MKNKIIFMNSTNQIQLKSKSILKVPLHQYEDFYFNVNDKEFKSTRIIADLLSPQICQIHQCDPTVNSFTINTENDGDFSTILKLVNFEKQDIQENEINFISEVLDVLQNDFIIVNSPDINITNENVFNLLKNHLKFEKFYSKSIPADIDYIASHFFEIAESNEERIMQLETEILEEVIKSSKLILRYEDQLLTFINKLYMKDANFSNLYQYVIFENVEKETIDEFLSIYNINDLDNSVWGAISNRLKQQVIKDDEELRTQNVRYKRISTNIL